MELASNFEVNVISNYSEHEHVFLMSVQTDRRLVEAPKAGQFYMLRAWGFDEEPLLSRPISVNFYNNNTGRLSFLYEVKGTGTQKLARLKKGDKLTLTGPLGNGFNTDEVIKAANGKPVAVVGGGIGIAPLYMLVAELKKKGADVVLYAGFRNFPFGIENIMPLCERVEVSTETGAAGYKGYITDLIDPNLCGAACTCGPEIMMKKTADIFMKHNLPVWVSKEEKMACGLGACLGCTCKSSKAHGEKPLCVCKQGPVFEGGAVYDVD